MWNKWKKKHPSPGIYVFARDLDAPEIHEIGWVVGEEGNTKIVVEEDPVMGKYIYDEWQPVPPPTEKWNQSIPETEKYVYVRNRDAPQKWEVGLSVIYKGCVKIVLIKDPGMKKQSFDEWQPVVFPNGTN